MRTRTIAYAVSNTSEPKTTAIMTTVDGRVWCWMPDKGLWIRPTSPVPSEYVTSPSGDVVTFLRAARNASSRGPALPVDRGDHLSIGGVRVDEEIVDAVDEEFSGVTWYAWEKKWLVAKDGSDDVVAVMRLPKGNELMAVFVLVIDGDPWLSDGHFALRVRPSQKQRADMLAAARAAPDAAAKLKAGMDRALQGHVAVPIAGNNIVKIGEVSAPRTQVSMVEHIHGPAVEWRWTAPGEMVVAFAGGRAVGAVMPMKTASEAAKTGKL